MSPWLQQIWHRWRISADEMSTRMLGALASGQTARQKPLQIGDLEPRILFSATPIDAANMPGAGDASTMVAEVEPARDENHSENEQSTTQAQSVREIVIVDGSVESLDQILDDLRESRPDADLFVLDPSRDGIEQISEILDDRRDVDSLHIVSHGSEGSVQLGNLWLNEGNLDGYAGQIAAWQGSLSSEADILFYGCELASNQDGQNLVESLSVLTGADVAASDDVTGHESLGGDWDLEFGIGTIDTEIPFSAGFQQAWMQTLATAPKTLFLHTDNVIGTEPAAIVATETCRRPK